MLRRAPLAAIAFLAACSGGGSPPPPSSPGAIGLASATYRVTEGARLDLLLRRTGGSAGRVSVSWRANAVSATDGVDYGYADGTVTWTAGDAADKSVSVWTVDDALVEGDETLTVDLSSPTGGATLATSSATVTIADADTPASGALRFSAPAYTVDEGAGAATITVERSGGSAGAVSIRCGTVTGGTATAGDDYESVPSTELAWADGDASPRTFTVPILDDASPEPYETVAIGLASPAGAPVAGASVATLTIRNDDTVIRLEQATYRVGEDGGTVRIRATKEGETPRVEVPFETSGFTAMTGFDFRDRRGSFIWGERETGTLGAEVTILDDGVREGDETFAFSLSPAAGVTLGAPTWATVTIVDDEPPPEGLVELTKADYPVSNYAGQVTISVRRVGGTAGTVGVSYATANGTAIAGADYTSTSGTLAWGPGDAADKTFTIPIADDLVVEHGETILLALSAPSGGAALGPRQTATVTITDDWARRGPPVLQDSTTALAWDEDAVKSPSVVWDAAHAQYVMYYQGEDAVHQRQIGRAVSVDGIAWTREPANAPVLKKGDAGKFDEFGVGKPSVLFDGTKWRMWYSNQDTNLNNDVPSAPRIGYATSDDGITWTRENAGDAVLDKGTAYAGYDTTGVSGPTVLLDGGTYRMWFTAHGWMTSERTIGYATSSDGVQWTKQGQVLPPDASGWAYDPFVAKDGAVFRMWFTDDGTYDRLGYATSSNGTSWQRYPDPLFVPPWQSWDDGSVTGATVVKDGERYLLWYHSAGTWSAGDIGLATSP